LAILALWGMATVHCKLERLPGFEFLKICCLTDSSSTSSKDCDSDGCGTVEGGKYRPEEQTASAPTPAVIFAFLLSHIETAPPDLLPFGKIATEPSTYLHKAWQFSFRAALPARMPPTLA